jgi:cysteine desulfurase
MTENDMPMNIYLDNNSTTPLSPEVMDAMMPYLTVKFGNASSIHSAGREAKKALEKARETIMHALGAANPECLCFTASGSEADNMAIQGVARALRHKGNHLVTSAVEHPAVLGPCRFLEEKGFQVTYVKPDESGLIRPEAVAAALRDDTILISIMHANNETGTINPIPAIGTIARERNILFHTDAVQSFCKAPFTVDELRADLLSVSAHKINGPKGVGALYIREGVPIRPLIYGGHQEAGLRAGTENVASIVGAAKAAELGLANMKDAAVRVRSLRDKLEKGLLKKVPHARLNGHPALRLPNTLNLSFPFVESESLLLELDLKGVAVSSGSACTSGTGEPSHVLLAMGIPHEICRGALRFSLGKQNTESEIDYVLQVLPEIVERIRAMSPLSAS